MNFEYATKPIHNLHQLCGGHFEKAQKSVKRVYSKIEVIFWLNEYSSHQSTFLLQNTEIPNSVQTTFYRLFVHLISQTPVMVKNADGNEMMNKTKANDGQSMI